ncbi:V-type proton ATPase subunit c1 [Vitis vinifera]|uniref:V-type proton ATPase proteolipid subunit n=1 Tax=Vitis vinifera TaxID=29760 RepID=A0A438KMQ3_VITVI|nr:V-type proton ATPase subunit c1 [Vitis vinifera]
MSTFSGDETAPFFGFLGAAAALVFSFIAAWPCLFRRIMVNISSCSTGGFILSVTFLGHGRGLWDCKERGGCGLHGSDATGARHEIDCPSCYGWSFGYLWLIIAVIISTGINPKAKSYYLFDGYAHLSSGLACGLAGLSAGMAIGIVGDAGVRANAQQPKLFVGMILILIFAEALALYGLIVGIILSSRAGQSRAE